MAVIKDELYEQEYNCLTTDLTGDFLHDTDYELGSNLHIYDAVTFELVAKHKLNDANGTKKWYKLDTVKIGNVGIDQVTANANEVVTKVGSVSTNSEIVSETPTIYNIEMTLADTEYSQLLPDNTKKVSANVQDGSSADNIRFAWETGKVPTPTTPYLKFPQNVQVEESDLKLTAKTLYFASSIAGKTIQIQVWA